MARTAVARVIEREPESSQDRLGELPAQARNFEARGKGCLVVDHLRRVTYVAPRARHCLELGGLRITSDRNLASEDPRQASMLRGALDAALASNPQPPPAVALARSKHVTPLVVTFTNAGGSGTHDLRPWHAEASKPVRAVFVLLRDPSWLDDEPLEQLAHQFGLSPRETQLCCHLARGRRLAQFAEQNQLSGETVKSHLKSVFRKLGVHNQVELVVSVLAVLLSPND